VDLVERVLPTPIMPSRLAPISSLLSPQLMARM
jgi:hypothetical protein